MIFRSNLGTAGELRMVNHEVNGKWDSVWALVLPDGYTWATSEWWPAKHSSKRMTKVLEREGWQYVGANWP
jgi:hypothetical protein